MSPSSMAPPASRRRAADSRHGRVSAGASGDSAPHGPAPDMREADLGVENEHIPGWFLLSLPPFAAPVAAALYLGAYSSPPGLQRAGPLRRGPQRTKIPHLILGAIYLMSCLFTVIALQPVFGFAPWWVRLPVLLWMLVVIPWRYRLARALPGEPTPDECSYRGQACVTREDPGVFVQRRMSFGYVRFRQPLGVDDPRGCFRP